MSNQQLNIKTSLLRFPGETTRPVVGPRATASGKHLISGSTEGETSGWDPVSGADERNLDQMGESVHLQIDKNLGSGPPTGSRPPADCRPVLVQRQRLGILLSSIVSSAAAVTVAASLCLLVLALICGKHR